MLTEEQKELLSDALSPLYQYLEKEVITDIARRIQKTMTYTRTAELQAAAMRELGYSPARIRSEVLKKLRADKDFQKLVEQNTLEYKRDVKEIIRTITEQAQAAKETIVADAGEMSWVDDMRVWESAGKPLVTHSRLNRIVSAITAHTAGELKNLTKSTGFKTVSGFEPIQNLYRMEMDKALIKMSSGAFSPGQCVRDVIHDLARSGIRTVDYASGRSYQLDTAARMCLRTAGNQLSAQIMDMNLRETGEALVQVSAHWGARNRGKGMENHEQWQGKVYSTDGKPHQEEEQRIRMEIRDLKETTGYDIHTGTGDVRGLHGINCRHQHFVFFEGTSSVVEYPPEPQPKTVNGKKYDYYAMTQKMRQMERGIRALKREKEALNALHQDSHEIQAEIRQKTAEYRQFTEECGVSGRTSRLRVESGTSDLTRTRAWKEYRDHMDRKLDFGDIKGVRFRKSVDRTNISSEDVETIKDTIAGLGKEYDIRLDEFEIGDYNGKQYRHAPMFFRPTENSGSYSGKLVVNNACRFWRDSGFREGILSSGYFAGNSLKEFVEHELAHVITFQGCRKYRDAEMLSEKLISQHTYGLSPYNLNAHDGAESIAEAFVLKRKGAYINKNAEKLLQEYVEVHKK